MDDIVRWHGGFYWSFACSQVFALGIRREMHAFLAQG